MEDKRPDSYLSWLPDGVMISIGCPNSGASRDLQTQTEDPSLRNPLKYERWAGVA
ncbi:hypothetical protein NFI96_023566, partial [Prochilodus magdalenae]